MLIAFSVENYRSFRSEAQLSMVAADLVSKPATLDATNVFAPTERLRLLTSAVVYGANASGKSNLISAVAFMRNAVLYSAQTDTPFDVFPYRLDTVTRQQPTRCELVFLIAGVVYRYGFVLTKQQVEQEWLYATPGRKEGYLFERTADGIRVNRKTFPEGLGLEKRTRPNALFVSVVALLNGARAMAVQAWFAALQIISSIQRDDDLIISRSRLRASPYQQSVFALLRRLDLGIADVRTELPGDASAMTWVETDDPEAFADRPIPYPITVKTIHHVTDSAGATAETVAFDLSADESHGTQRLFVLAEPIVAALQEGTLLIIDEFDARLHPLMTSELIKLFQGTETNPHHAQLVVTTHDTNLLSSQLFRRDQVWFVEKSRQGASQLYSLAEFRDRNGPVRNDAAYEKNYIQGRYGAIPFIGDLSAAIGASRAESAE